MICPKCQGPYLETVPVKGRDFTVERCSRCKGIWFDASELDRAMVRQPLSIPREAVRLVARCPKCEKALYAFHYPGTRVTIEVCRACAGVWLDAGEFSVVREARRSMPHNVESDEQAQVDGVKGALLQFIDNAIDRLRY